WQMVFGTASAVMLALALVLYQTLPHRRPTLQSSYGRLMHSLIDLARTQPKLWTAGLVSGLPFGCFTGFFTVLSFVMKDIFGRGASEAGAFGVVGLAGAMTAPLVGKISDRRGPAFAI